MTMLEVRQTPDRGRGVFAAAPIVRGQCLVICEGWLAASDKLEDHWFAMQVGPDLWLCSAGAGLDDCINHSCEPNAGFLTGEPALFALARHRGRRRDHLGLLDLDRRVGLDAGVPLRRRSCRGIVRPWGELTTAERALLRGSALAYLRQ